MTHETETQAGKSNCNLAVFISVKPFLSRSKQYKEVLLLKGWLSVVYKFSKLVVVSLETYVQTDLPTVKIHFYDDSWIYMEAMSKLPKCTDYI